jgi:uncharacterized membrane protein
MSQLLVFGVDSPATAEKVLDLARDLAKQQLLELADAAWVERTSDGNVKLHQSVNLTAMMAGSGAVTGALWGTLVGLLFLNPLAGAVVGAGVGAGTGAVTGKLTDIGVDDDLIREIGQTLEPGKAAVFFLSRNATVDRVIEAIKPYNPKIIQTNLSVDSEKELIEALQGQPVGASSAAQQPGSGQEPASVAQPSSGQESGSAAQPSSGQPPSS